MNGQPADRAAERLAWVRGMLGDPAAQLVPLAGDASFRSYWRVARDDGDRVLMDSPPAQEDVRPWLDIGDRLRAAGLATPRVYAGDVERGFLLIEDFGDRLYLPELRDDSVEDLYGAAMDALLAMRSGVDDGGLPAYDAAFLMREMLLLPEWFLQRHLGRLLGADEMAVLHATFDRIVASALEQPQGFVHRDYHSRNLLVLPGRIGPGIIDFQGAVRGPITYDLASLLRDCYVAWDPARVDAWAEGHRRRLQADGQLDAAVDAATFLRWFDLIGLQRHIKVLGLFCRLAYRDGKPGYLADLPRVLDYVVTVAGRHAELGEFTDLLRRCVLDRDVAEAAA